MNYIVNEGNKIGGMEAQAFGTDQKRLVAGADVTKGMPLMISDNWELSPATDNAIVVGLAFDDYKEGDEVVLDCEGFVKIQSTEAAITAGDALVAAGTGLCRKATSRAENIFGYAFNGVSAAGGVIYTKFHSNPSGGTPPVAISDITGLQDALDAKAAADHDHVIADITGLQDALDAKADVTP